jgi:hypothetical protein
MVVYAAHIALLLGNLLPIVASWLLGSRLIWVCRVAVFVNGIALICPRTCQFVPLLLACPGS